jgi:hypothetical protein
MFYNTNMAAVTSCAMSLQTNQSDECAIFAIYSSVAVTTELKNYWRECSRESSNFSAQWQELGTKLLQKTRPAFEHFFFILLPVWLWNENKSARSVKTSKFSTLFHDGNVFRAT